MRTFNLGIAVFCGLAGLAESSAQAQQGYQFFARASNLEAGEVWVTTRGHDSGPKLDMSVQKWNPDTGRWSPCLDGAANCGTNENTRTWGQPIYSPADGEITSCYRAFPDNPAPGQLRNDVHTDEMDVPPPDGIHKAGNNVWIRTDEGDMIALTHMQQWSIPTSVCPKGNEPGVDLADKDDVNGKYVEDLYIPQGDRPRVSRGQFIGLAGNSGQSDGPHLHIQHNSIIYGDAPHASLPVRFKQVYTMDWSANVAPSWNDWYPAREEPLSDVSEEVNRIALHPAPFLRRTDAGIGTISEVDTVFMDDALAVTAVRNGQGNLQLTSWDCAITDIDRLEDEIAGSATLINVARLSPELVMVGLRTGAGKLKLILYSVSFQGVFTREAEYNAGPIDMLDMTSYRDMHLVTAARDDRGGLELIEWTVAPKRAGTGPGGWSILRRGSATAGYVSALAVTGAKAFTGVGVAVRTAEQTLLTIPYRIDNDGNTFVRGTDRETNDPIGTQIDITALPRGFAAAGDDSKQRLKLVGYGASANGNLVGAQTAFIAGTVSRVDITSTPDAGSDVITTVRDGNGELLLISWAMTDDGKQIRRGGSVKAGAFAELSTAPTSRIDGFGDPRDMLLTAIRSGLGKLKLIYWDVNLAD